MKESLSEFFHRFGIVVPSMGLKLDNIEDIHTLF